MADRRFHKNAQSFVSQTRKVPSPSTKAEGSKRGQTRPQAKCESGLAEKPTDVFVAKEEQYKLLNAELEAKTAALVKQAERLVKEQNEALSKPLSTLTLTDFRDEDDTRMKREQGSGAGVKVVAKKKPKSAKQDKQLQTKTQQTVEDQAHSFLEKTIRSLEEKMNDASSHQDVEDGHQVLDAVDNVGSDISDAQIRVFKAKLRIMQEELDQLSNEYYKKDDENVKLSARIKELEEDRGRLQKTSSVQQTQIEKHRALAEEADKKCDGLQLQVSGLNKEIDNLNRNKKQAAAAHGSVEVRLNRTLEEVERLKTQLNKTQQMNKDKISVEHHSKENLLAENKMLKKQKAELIVGFKKQLKLIDVLKRQKMHFEAAKLLSFTEDEFMKALDWGKV